MEMYGATHSTIVPGVSPFNPQSIRWSPVKKTFFALAMTLGGGYILHQSEGIKPLIDKTITLLRLKSNPPIPVSNATEISTYVAQTTNILYEILYPCKISYALDGKPSFEGACSSDRKIWENDRWIENKIKRMEAYHRELVRKGKDPTIDEALESNRRACKNTQQAFKDYVPVSCDESGSNARCPTPPVKLEECSKIPLELLVFEKGVTPTCLEQAECILGINLHANTTQGRPPTLSEGITRLKIKSKELRIRYSPDKNEDKELAHKLSATINSASSFVLSYLEDLQFPYTIGKSEIA